MTTSLFLIEAYDSKRRVCTGTSTPKYAIDAALAAVALRQPGPVTVFASDEDDLRKLCGDRVVVRGL
ncbi:hypothetical protein ABZ023_17090 [Streptomyces sp. NPDC006367]|uniref:hypothetical protein n=1 Tax=unclassified Streptomyces TaxID=2593676 RepID=UPI0033B309C4